MDEEDFSDEMHGGLFEEEEEDEEADDGPGSPTQRAVVRDGRVTVLMLLPCLLSGPVAGAAFRERAADGVTVADLTPVGDGELVVDLLADGGGARARRALERWAASVGYERIWFPGRVRDLATTAVARVARVQCPSCGHRYDEHRQAFWLAVHAARQFPSYCLLCGHDLPQWSVSRR